MIAVRFITLTGQLKTVKSETFETLSLAHAAVASYATAQGYTNVKIIDCDEDGGVRFTATTSGGRGGRNVAFGDFDY